VAFTLTRLTARIREEADAAAERERRTAALYAMDRELAEATDTAGLLRVAERHLSLAVPGEARILLPDAGSVLDHVDALFFPLKSPRGVLGMVAVRRRDPERPLSDAERDTL